MLSATGGRVAALQQLRALAPHRLCQNAPSTNNRCVVSVLNQPQKSAVKGGDQPWRGLFNPWRRSSAQATELPPTQPHPMKLDTDTLQALESVYGRLDNKPMVPPPRPVVVIISGPSGVGKDSVLARLKENRGDLYFVVTATSRAMRPLEVEGKDYFFVSKEKFEEWIAEGQLLEHALVYGDYKGIPRQQVDQALAAGTDVVLRIDVQGAATVKKLMPEAISVFVAAESEAKLVERLVSRKTETLDKMIVRVQTARQELEEMKKFDYVVVNQEGRLDECADLIGSIIDAEKAKVSRSGQQQQQGQATV